MLPPPLPPPPPPPTMESESLEKGGEIAAACTMFTAEDPKHRKFALIHCWRILKDKPRWIERRKQLSANTPVSNKKQKTKADASPSSAALVPAPTTGGVDAAAAAAEDPSKRPDGKKTEKKKLRQRSTIEALDYLVAKMKQTDDAKEMNKEQRYDI
nr:unnamed protein product [Digitaria exilis]